MSEPVVIGQEAPPAGANNGAGAPPPSTSIFDTGQKNHLPAGQLYQTIVNGIVYTWVADGYGSGMLDTQNHPPSPVPATRATDRAPTLIRDKAGNVTGYWDPDNPSQGVVMFGSGAAPAPQPLGNGYVWNPSTSAVEALPPQKGGELKPLGDGTFAVWDPGQQTWRRLVDDQSGEPITDGATAAQHAAALSSTYQGINASQSNVALANRQQQYNEGQKDYENRLALAKLQAEQTRQGYEDQLMQHYTLPRQMLADQNAARLNQVTEANYLTTSATQRENAAQNAGQAAWTREMDRLQHLASPGYLAQLSSLSQNPGQLWNPGAVGSSMPMPNPQAIFGNAATDTRGQIPSFGQALGSTPSYRSMDPRDLEELRAYYNQTIPGSMLFAVRPGG